MPRVSDRAGHLLLLMLLFSSASWPATKTATLGITAEVLPACSAGSTNVATLGQYGTLNFGSYPALAVAVSAIGQGSNGGIRVNCVSNTPWRVLISAGSSGNVNARRMQGPSSATVTYNLYTSNTYLTVWDNTVGITGTGTGSDQLLRVYGRVPAQSAPVAGVYTDTVTVTVMW